MLIFSSPQFANGKGRPVTRVSANNEVVLAAGTGHTPQLLQLAGIGPKSLLQGLGIDVVVDLPGVGKNFQDHPTLYVQGTCMNPSSRFPFPHSHPNALSFQGLRCQPNKAFY